MSKINNKTKSCLYLDNIILDGSVRPKYFCKNKESAYYSNFLKLPSDECVNCDKYKPKCIAEE